MMVGMEQPDKEELLQEVFAIIAEQIGMLFEQADAARLDALELREAVDFLGFRSDMDKEDFHRLEQRVDRLET
jgi:hypothetical protein